ncbi:hypothetical protein A2U01_0076736 [Trifolium medium]|uniref:Uncharacterized protein n=1 Tax=Trifolium medium TaxID=97028 RepID=A0A392T5C0_9FABA|nr:hypothetical protein [Trifolium medium]
MLVKKKDGGANQNYKGFLEVMTWTERRWMLPLQGSKYGRVDAIRRKDCK